MCRVSAILLLNYLQERKLFFQAKSGAGGASPHEVYDLVARGVSDLQSRTAHLYLYISGIYRDGVRSDFI